MKTIIALFWLRKVTIEVLGGFSVPSRPAIDWKPNKKLFGLLVGSRTRTLAGLFLKCVFCLFRTPDIGKAILKAVSEASMVQRTSQRSCELGSFWGVSFFGGLSPQVKTRILSLWEVYGCSGVLTRTAADIWFQLGSFRLSQWPALSGALKAAESDSTGRPVLSWWWLGTGVFWLGSGGSCVGGG